MYSYAQVKSEVLYAGVNSVKILHKCYLCCFNFVCVIEPFISGIAESDL